MPGQASIAKHPAFDAASSPTVTSSGSDTARVSLDVCRRQRSRVGLQWLPPNLQLAPSRARPRSCGRTLAVVILAEIFNESEVGQIPLQSFTGQYIRRRIVKGYEAREVAEVVERFLGAEADHRQCQSSSSGRTMSLNCTTTHERSSKGLVRHTEESGVQGSMSDTDIKYHRDVSRWEPNARGRLEQAALKLYIERGFEQTTVAEIANEARLTERTFFRYFADKREVLFWGAGTLQEFLVIRVAGALEPEAAINVVASALEAAGALLEERRDSTRQRQAVISASAELRERELIKLASFASAMAEALRHRGVESTTASLAAEAGIAVFRVAFDLWIIDTGERDLSQLIRESFVELKVVTAGGLSPVPDSAGRSTIGVAPTGAAKPPDSPA